MAFWLGFSWFFVIILGHQIYNIMKKLKLCILLALLLMVGGVTMKAQELQPIIENESGGLYEPVFQNATGNELLMRFIETPGTCGSILP